MTVPPPVGSRSGPSHLSRAIGERNDGVRAAMTWSVAARGPVTSRFARERRARAQSSADRAMRKPAEDTNDPSRFMSRTAQTEDSRKSLVRKTSRAYHFAGYPAKKLHAAAPITA